MLWRRTLHYRSTAVSELKHTCILDYKQTLKQLADNWQWYCFLKAFRPDNEKKKKNYLVLLYLYDQKPCGWIFQVQEFGCCIKRKKSKYLIWHYDISIKVHRSICDLFYNGRGGQQPLLYDWCVIRQYRLIYILKNSARAWTCFGCHALLLHRCWLLYVLIGSLLKETKFVLRIDRIKHKACIERICVNFITSAPLQIPWQLACVMLFGALHSNKVLVCKTWLFQHLFEHLFE